MLDPEWLDYFRWQIPVGERVRKVMADTGAFNQASIALLQSLRFRQDGCLRQHQFLNGVLHDRLLFSLLASEWEPSQH